MKNNIPKPSQDLDYQYIVILCLNKGSYEYTTSSIEETIEAFEKQGWTYKGKDIGYPYKLYFECPKTAFDIAHFAMYENMGNII